MDTKKFTDIAEKRSGQYATIEQALEIVFQFVVDNDRIVYGGTAIDWALKHVGHPGIYTEESIPDYDFMSPDFYEDSIVLADILARKFDGVSSINALHITSRRVRVNFVSVADVTYIPAEIYKQIPTLKVRVGKHFVRVVHPDFQRIDLHRSLATVYEGAPLEVLNHRASKDQKRYKLLNSAFPIATGPRPKKENKEKNKISVNGMTAQIGTAKIQISPDHAYSGDIAYAVYYDYITDKIKKAKDTHGYLRNLYESVMSPANHRWAIRYTNNFSDFSPDKHGERYDKLLDDIRLRGRDLSEKGDKNSVNLLLDSSQTRLATRVINGVRVVGIQSLMVDILVELFLSKDDYFRHLYDSAVQMVYITELLFEKGVILSDNPLFLGGEFFGDYTLTPEYTESMIRTYCSVLDRQPPIMRPKFGYYPVYSAENDAIESEAEPFDPADSDMFRISGSKRKEEFIDYKKLLAEYKKDAADAIGKGQPAQ
jgi:hypothetical protein